MILYSQKCPECKGEIKLGIAIKPEPESSCFYNPPPITHKTMELISVYKCMSCGYSCNNEYDLIWSET